VQGRDRERDNETQNVAHKQHEVHNEMKLMSSATHVVFHDRHNIDHYSEACWYIWDINVIQAL